MVFNSITFLLFFVVVFFLYWFAGKKNKTLQNWILLLSSYFFYGFASLKIVPILLLATVIFYVLGIYIGKAWDREDAKGEKIAGWLTATGVVLGVGFLLYFKYLNFFIQSFVDLFNLFGLQTSWHTMKIIMPLGISFFTFKLLAYVLDVQHGKIQPTRDFVQFATYIAFFPCILSGPIDRPAFMKQLTKLRVFDYDIAADGCRQFLWGMFKKVVIADNCASYVDAAWGNIDGSSASTLLLAAVLYAFELYADFSGYSDMAIGVGKWLGLKITDNFKTPFYALNVADFWRRWHISLTGWMTDYVFMPLNLKMRDWGKVGMSLAIVLNFLIVGMWHGDNWIYAVYGLYHGLLFVPLIISGAFYRNDKIQTNKLGLPVAKDFGRMLLTFVLVLFGFIIFRAESVGQIGHYVASMCDSSLLTMPAMLTGLKRTILFAVLMLVVEWLNREKKHGLDIPQIIIGWRIAIYYVLIVLILEFAGDAQSFIYFQF